MYATKQKMQKVTFLNFKKICKIRILKHWLPDITNCPGLCCSTRWQKWCKTFDRLDDALPSPNQQRQSTEGIKSV